MSNIANDLTHFEYYLSLSDAYLLLRQIHYTYLYVLVSVERGYTVLSTGVTIAATNDTAGSFLIDSTLGRNTLICFDYIGTDIQPSVILPDMTEYNRTSDPTVTHDTVFGIYRFSIPDAVFQVRS